MILSPEWLLTVALAGAVALLGVVMWSRRPRALGNVVYGLMGLSLGCWTVSDWLARSSFVSSETQMLWRVFLFFTFAFIPWIALAATAVFEHARSKREVIFFTFTSCLSFVSLIFVEPPFGSIFPFLLIVIVAVIGLTRLYPHILVSQRHEDRQRSAYRLALFLVYLAAGTVAFVGAPDLRVFLLPILTACFFIGSLLAFSRASFLDMTLGSLETFLILLSVFAGILMLRSQSALEAIVTMCGALLVGAFGLQAIRRVREVSSQRQAVEQVNVELQRVDQAKGDFIDMVAHQLRGPLGGIRIAAASLEAGDFGPVSEQVQVLSRQMQALSTRLLTMAETFLNASRLEMGTYVSDRRVVHVANLVTGVVNMIQPLADAKHLTLAVNIDQKLFSEILIDQEVLEQVLYQLMENAVKYTERGGISVNCFADPKMLRVQVQDTGVGLEPEERSALFQKFQRGIHARERTIEGTGLGLYVVKHLVEAAGGRIHVESPGLEQGSTFTFELPVVYVKG